MSTAPQSGPRWSGEMLDDPEMVAAFAAQLRRALSNQAEFVARMYRDAEAMWKANPPEGYSSFEAWWRHRWVTSPFAAIQEHLEEAAKLTFALEARYRKGRHEIPEARQAAAAGRPAPALGGAPSRPVQQSAPSRAAAAPPLPQTQPRRGFMDLVREESA